MNTVAGRSPVAFQLLWMLSLSAIALGLGLVPLYGALVAGIAVGMADESLVIRDRNALAGISFAFFIPIYFAIIGLKLDLIHHFDPLRSFLGFLALRVRREGGEHVYLGARPLSGESRFPCRRASPSP